MRTIAGLAIFASVFIVAVDANAQTGLDAQENIFGATNVNAITGHGGLTAGISARGDVTILTWPSPSHTDQLGYISLNGLGARDLPRFGAPEGAGIVLGLVVEQGDGLETRWFRDGDTWDATQSYATPSSPNPETTFVSDELGLTAVVTDAIHPSEDVLVRRVVVTRSSTSPVTDAWLISYANLSPTPPNGILPELPIADWAVDGRNDFAAVWDAEANAVIHFHPDDQRVHNIVGSLLVPPEADFGPIGAALAAPPADAAQLVDELENDYAGGSWAVMTTVPPPDQHHVGPDGTDFCAQADRLIDNLLGLPDIFDGFVLPLDPNLLDLLRCQNRDLPSSIASDFGWDFAGTDPWEDAADGTLEGGNVAAVEVAEVLRTPLTFAGDEATASLVIGYGGDLFSARSAAATDPAEIPGMAEEAVEDWLNALRVPGQPGSAAHEVAMRTMINIRVGTDRQSGALVASLARQPPYGLDWPRDGAFFNILLDAAGMSELVTRRIDLYASWQRTEPSEPQPFIGLPPPVDPDTGRDDTYPAYGWEMNYYPNGAPGGTFRFEIDTTAFVIWTAVAHAGWVDDPETYLRQRWDWIVTGTDLLARWRDAETGLHAPAQEDDAAGYTQTLHGAITVFGALDLAARGARLIGEEDDAARWEARASELRVAMEENFYDYDTDAFFMEESGRAPFLASGLIPVGPTGWLVWPLTPYPDDDPVIERQLVRDLTIIEPILALESVGGSYYMKNTLSLAMQGRPRWNELINSLPETLASHATPDTRHFGEIMVVVERDGVPVADQRTSNPHLWEGALFALTVWAVEDPAALTRYEEVLPPSLVRTPSDLPDDPPGEDGRPDAGSDVGDESDAGRPDAGAGDAFDGERVLSSDSGDDGCCSISVSGRVSRPGVVLLVGLCVLLLVGRRHYRETGASSDSRSHH